jgi:hypothetical protein
LLNPIIPRQNILHFSRWPYSAKRPECREKENDPHFPCRGIHQTVSCTMRLSRNLKQGTPGSKKSLSSYQETARTQKSDYRHRQNAADCHLQHPEEKRTLQCGIVPPIGQTADSA